MSCKLSRNVCIEKLHLLVKFQLSNNISRKKSTMKNITGNMQPGKNAIRKL